MSDRLGVLLVQLGGPASREELKPFLYELFVDPEILGISFVPLRKLVAWLIAPARAPKSAATYERITWSPIRRWSETQARLLEAELAKRSLGAAPAPVVRVGMTCSYPFVEDALSDLRKEGATRLLVLPLYPQYSVTTTRGSRSRVTSALRKMGWSPSRTNAPDAWYEEPGFVATIRPLRMDRGYDTAADADVVTFLAQASGRAPQTVSFGTEGPQLAALGAVPVVFGPGDITVAHQTGEYVPIDELHRAAEILEAAVLHFCA